MKIKTPLRGFLGVEMKSKTFVLFSYSVNNIHDNDKHNKMFHVFHHPNLH